MNKSLMLAAVLTLILASCQKQIPSLITTMNTHAALVGDLPANPLGWKVITSGFGPNDTTMSTLFGNDSAVKYARTRGGDGYPTNSRLALVTWRQQQDSRWFGARIPDQVKSVEFVTVASDDSRTTYTYERFAGVPFKRVGTSSKRADERVKYLLSQRAAVMP